MYKNVWDRLPDLLHSMRAIIDDVHAVDDGSGGIFGGGGSGREFVVKALRWSWR